MSKPRKQRTRLWVKGDSQYKEKWTEWARNQGVIAEDFLRKVLDKTMEHGSVSFDVECGYENSQSDNQTL